MPWPDPLAPLDRQSIRRQFPRAPSTNLEPEPADRDFGTAIRYPWLTILIPGYRRGRPKRTSPWHRSHRRPSSIQAALAEDAVSHQLFDLARIAAVWGGAADRVGRLDADRQVDVGAVGIER